MKNVQDQILLTYIYEDQEISENALTLKAQSKLVLYGNEEKEVTKEIETEVKEKVGDTLTFSIDVDKKELQKGYTIKDRVLRAAMVKVSK